MKRAVVACIVILVLAGVVLAESVKKSAGLQFKGWGISFTTPAQWQRWPSAKESAAAAQLQQKGGAKLKFQIVHLASWGTADEAAFMILFVTRERSGRTLQLSESLARTKRDDKRAKECGDATQINRLEIGKVGGRECIVHDVTLRGGRRMLTYEFPSGSEEVTVQWLFRDAASFVQLKPDVDGVLKTLSFDGNQKKQ